MGCLSWQSPCENCKVIKLRSEQLYEDHNWKGLKMDWLATPMWTLQNRFAVFVRCTCITVWFNINSNTHIFLDDQYLPCLGRLSIPWWIVTRSHCQSQFCVAISVGESSTNDLRHSILVLSRSLEVCRIILVALSLRPKVAIWYVTHGMLQFAFFFLMTFNAPSKYILNYYNVYISLQYSTKVRQLVLRAVWNRIRIRIHKISTEGFSLHLDCGVSHLWAKMSLNT